MPSTDLTSYTTPPLLTEREVRLAGQVSNRLCTLRGMLADNVETGSITVKTTYGSQSLTIPKEELEALVSLLIERDEAFLTGLNIELER